MLEAAVDFARLSEHGFLDLGSGRAAGRSILVEFKLAVLECAFVRSVGDSSRTASVRLFRNSDATAA